MQCINCKTDIRRVRSITIDDRILRIHECPECHRKYASEETFYPIANDKGREIKSEMHTLIYYQTKKRVTTSKPKQKRKVAGPTKPVKEGEVYLTYGELFEKFQSMTKWTDINDYRPYPLLEHSIIVWTNDGTERAYQYEPENFRFVLIEDAKTYEEILDKAWRKKV